MQGKLAFAAIIIGAFALLALALPMFIIIILGGGSEGGAEGDIYGLSAAYSSGDSLGCGAIAAITGNYTFNGKFAPPITGPLTVTSPFGSRINPVTGARSQHDGTDLGATLNTPAYATAPGTVTFAGSYGTCGNMVKIDHGSVGGVKYETLYCHFNSISVQQGQTVGLGQEVGKVGSTGRSTGPHLHFEVHKNGKAVNAMGGEIDSSICSLDSQIGGVGVGVFAGGGQVLGSGSGNAAVALSLTQRGVPYVYGGNAWGGGLDCSGLVQQTYIRLGINLPRTAAAQSVTGQVIYTGKSRAAAFSVAAPGDGVGVSNAGPCEKAQHIGIYIGGGKIMHCPQPGKNCTTTDFSYYDSRGSTFCVRRYVS